MLNDLWVTKTLGQVTAAVPILSHRFFLLQQPGHLLSCKKTCQDPLSDTKTSSCHGLPREEEMFLHEALSKIIADPDVEYEDELQNDLQGKTERYSVTDSLSFFSLVGGKKEQGYGTVYKSFNDKPANPDLCTCVNLKVSTVSVEAEASQLVPTNKDTANAIKEILEKNTPRLVSVSKNSFQNLEVIKKNIDAIKLAKANPRLANNAKRLMTTGTVSARKTRQVQKAFGGTALAMTKGARIMGAATAGIFLVMDVVSLVEDSKHLHEGAKADYAAELRKQAQDLELKLQELIQIHDSLTQ
ncbi:apolipoprotein L3-like protein [Cricetulus griseus]|nr:apolipoprotein L3-like protein [Cricetulus griseus]